MPGAEVAKFNDVAGLSPLDSGEFCAVIVEPVQGEGGLRSLDPAFAAALNDACRKNDVLLIADEIQTGLGRCGYELASSAVGLEPDIVTLSKPLAGGLPLSATLIPAKVNDLLHVGEHGTTFGGGPVTTAVAGLVVETVLDPGFLESVRDRAGSLEAMLHRVQASNAHVTEVRGIGMLRGLALDETGAEKIPDILAAALERGLLILRSGTNVLRIAPPLVVGPDEIAEGESILIEALENTLGEKGE